MFEKSDAIERRRTDSFLLCSTLKTDWGVVDEAVHITYYYCMTNSI
jgi:hypothetical protein